MGYPNRRGGGGNRGQQQQGERQPTPNEQISIEARHRDFVANLNHYKSQIEAVLPATVTFERFRAVIVMAIRRAPDLLECFLPSLINACLNAAHDGLLPDGRQAAIVRVWNTKERRNDASYRPMVAGLIEQIYRSGFVSFAQAETVYAGEPFRVRGGTDPGIEHEIQPNGEKRGDPIGVYAIARLKDGGTTFRYMTVADVQKIRELAQTDKVWAEHWGEMAQKTVLRRLRKRLPGCQHLNDEEEKILFPQFSAEQPAALGRIPPKPTMAQFENHRLEHQPENGVPLDWGAGVDDRQPVASRSEEKRDERPAQTKREEPGNSEPRGEQGAAGDQQQQADDFDWDGWRSSLLEQLAQIATAVDVNSRWANERETISRAPDEIQDEINGAFNDRLIELASSPGAAGARGDGPSKPAGESA